LHAYCEIFVFYFSLRLSTGLDNSVRRGQDCAQMKEDDVMHFLTTLQYYPSSPTRFGNSSENFNFGHMVCFAYSVERIVNNEEARLEATWGGEMMVVMKLATIRY
jgi:hypothetical protein